MRVARLIPFGVAVAASACALTATMIPVEGPLSQQRPVPVIKARATGVMGNSGDLLFSMPDGDVCKGRWSSAAGVGVTIGSAGLMSQYGNAYLTGFAVSSGAGQNAGQALAVCAKGRSVQLEFITGAGSGHGFGIAKDNESNIYRFVF